MTFLLITLAAYRLTRIITVDKVTERPRAWAEDRAADGHPKLAYFVTCPWCVSMYVAAAVVAITDLIASVPLPGLQALAASTVCGLIGAELDSG